MRTGQKDCLFGFTRNGQIMKLSQIIGLCGECLGRTNDENLEDLLPFVIKNCCQAIERLALNGEQVQEVSDEQGQEVTESAGSET